MVDVARRVPLPLALAACMLGGCSLRSACSVAQRCAMQPDRPSAGAGYRIYAHAHNDYEHAHPLWDALAHGFHSVEADLFERDGELVVSHDGGRVRGTLRALYLRPLARAARDRGGSVLGDGEPFYLWIDLKSGSAALRERLRAVLDGLPMLTRFGDDGSVGPGAITVVLTGDSAATAALAALPGPRPYCRSSDVLTPGDPAADGPARFYSLRYDDYLTWNGEGAPDPDDAHRLDCLVANAHAAGRKLPLWAAPETPAFWRAALTHGVDFIGTDDLAGLGAFLDEECREQGCARDRPDFPLPSRP